MHPTIRHLLARAGKTVPAGDGRKIILVLWGGIMRGARGAGSVIALSDLGLQNAFDEIHTVSAGFPLASYFLAGQTRLGMSLFYDDLVSTKFLNRLRFWKGMDIAYLMDCFRKSKPLDIDSVLNHPTRLFIRAVNVQKKQLEYLEVHKAGKKNFWALMQAAVSVPILHRHPAKIGKYNYIDTNINAYLKQHMRHSLATDATDILVIYNDNIQRRFDATQDPRVVEICPPPFPRLSRFERQPEILKKFALDMGSLVKKTFGRSGGIEL